MRRKPNVEQRRRDLCDAAIELLAADGARGLTHLRVDRRAGVADGTTSFYYQTRSTLLRGAIDRVVELDVADFTAALNASTGGEVDSLLSRLAEQAMRTAVEPERTRARARFELMMIAARDPGLSVVFDDLIDKFVAMSTSGGSATSRPLSCMTYPPRRSGLTSSTRPAARRHSPTERGPMPTRVGRFRHYT